jgi:type 1 glutamine amidotransferase
MSRNLLLSGGPGHDFDATSRSVAILLAEHDVETTIVSEPAAALAALQAGEDGTNVPYDLLTVNALRWSMGLERYAQHRDEYAFVLRPADAAVIERFVTAGGGLLALHGAVICFDTQPIWRTLCGASWDWNSSCHPPLGEARITVTAAGREHAITEGLDDFTLLDEVYGFLDADPGIVPLLSSAHGGRAHPLLWARAVGKGRVVTDLLGHGLESFEHPAHRTILRRAAVWTIQEQRS